MTMKTWHLKTYEMQQKQSSEGSVQQYTLPQAILPQETRKTLNRQHNFTPKTTGKRRKHLKKISRRREIIKIRTEIMKKK